MIIMQTSINRIFKSIFIILFLFLSNCNFLYKNNGTFGHSASKEEAAKNGSIVYSFIADKNEFHLLDGTVLTTDTAWTEVSFSYLDGKRVLDSTFGFHLSIPFKKAVPNSFTFTFSLLDTNNRMFTNGITEDLCQLCPMYLTDEMKVILEQKDTDTAKGWTNPIITDTITYKRLK